jgi:hypothetical protein
VRAHGGAVKSDIRVIEIWGEALRRSMAGYLPVAIRSSFPYP